MTELERSARIIRALESPERHDRSVFAVDVIETHISWVLLTGNIAYKFKKPVDLGFVDFTTLDKRRFYCDEEIRLNRRLAPELYLGVVPISGTPDAPVLDGEGEAIEYAVKMRQFSQDQLLSHLVERGQLTTLQIDELAGEVADFHGRIDVAGGETPFGTSESVIAPVNENFRHLLPAGADRSHRELVERLKDWSHKEFAARQPEFRNRKQRGFVRECHGDMHLGNMVLHDGSVTIFDCIEFNESFRWIDVLSEVAFCAMDLEDRGRGDLSHRFLNAYLEITGDYDGLAMLPFYLVYRALVRAKVALLRLSQSGLDAHERAEVNDELEGYLALAEQYTKRPSPLLLVTYGFSGSGKTTLTQPLVESLGAIRVRSDIERKRLFEISAAVSSDRPPLEQLYSKQATERTYAELERHAGSLLRAGFTAIVDATFLKRRHRNRFRHLARQISMPLVILDFQAGEQTLRERLTRRRQAGSDASDADVPVLERQLASHDPIEADERPDVITVNSEDPAAAEMLLTTVAKLTSTVVKTAHPNGGLH